MKANTMFNSHAVLGLVFALGVMLIGMPGEVGAQGPQYQVGAPAYLGTAFTYQGQFIDNGSPVNDTCDFEFELYRAASGGTQVGSTISMTITVNNGLFTAQLDFGPNIFTGSARRWLETRVRCTGDSGYTNLGRQELTPVPYALALPGLWTQQTETTPNVIGGIGGVTTGVVGATIGGGGHWEIGCSFTNWAGLDELGLQPEVQTTDHGGTANRSTRAFAHNSTNYLSAAGSPYRYDPSTETCPNFVTDDYGTVGGGASNYAGNSNTDLTDATFATAGGGRENIASAYYATVSGGRSNTASGWYTAIGGGNGNSASGYAASVPGGWNNAAQGDRSFAAGRRAKARHPGTFVWADDTDADFASTAANQFLIRASGGVGIGTTKPAAQLDVAGRTRTSVLEITGGSDLAEPFAIVGAEKVEPGMVVAIDPERPGQLRIANKAYDRTVAGCVSGANGVNPGLTMQQEGNVADGAFPVALSGRVYCWADASYGDIQPGDLLTTSDTPGHVMRVTNHAQAQGAIIGKAMTSLNEGPGLVLVLVSLQ